MGIDNVRDALNDLEEELSSVRADLEEARNDRDAHQERSWDAEASQEEAEKIKNQVIDLVWAIMDNLNGDLVKVWQDHRETLSDIGYPL